MLLAPVLPMSSPSDGPSSRSRAHRRSLSIHAVDPVRLASQRRWLLSLWLVLGALAVLCIPPLRGGVASGWTLPFWLIAAPLINWFALTWAQRRLRRQQR